MQTHAKLGLKWHRLMLAMLLTLIIADTAPHPQLAPGLLQTLASRLQTHFTAVR